MIMSEVKYQGKKAVCFSIYRGKTIVHGKVKHLYVFIIQSKEDGSILYRFPYTGTLSPDELK